MDSATITALGVMFTGLASLLGVIYKLIQLRLGRIEHLVNLQPDKVVQKLETNNSIDLRTHRDMD